MSDTIEETPVEPEAPPPLPHDWPHRIVDGLLVPFTEEEASALPPGWPRLIRDGKHVFLSAEGLAAVDASRPRPGPPEVRPIYKATLYERMTDAELEAIENFLQRGATRRQRMRYQDAVYLDPNDPDLNAMAVALFGKARATELLTPTI